MGLLFCKTGVYIYLVEDVFGSFACQLICYIMKACPNCQSFSRHRLKRRGIIKLISGFRSYECDSCGQSYIWNSLLDKSFKARTKKSP